MPAVYKGLKGIADECNEQRVFNEKMMEVFDSEPVKERLGSMMDLTVKVLECISKYYEQRRYSKSFSWKRNAQCSFSL